MTFARLSPEDYHALCEVVLKRDHYRCRSCKYRQNLTAHHIIFRSEGGPDATWNLVTLCASCHNGVHHHGLVIDVAEGNVAGPDGGADGVLKFIKVNGWKPK